MGDVALAASWGGSKERSWQGVLKLTSTEVELGESFGGLVSCWLGEKTHLFATEHDRVCDFNIIK